MFNIWILLICALRTHNSKPILKKVYWELTTFSILNKTFSKIDWLMCSLSTDWKRTWMQQHSGIDMSEFLSTMIYHTFYFDKAWYIRWVKDKNKNNRQLLLSTKASSWVGPWEWYCGILVREYNDFFNQLLMARAVSNWVDECDA